MALDASSRPRGPRSLPVALGLWALLVGVFFWPVFTGRVIAPLDILDSLQQPWAGSGETEVHNAFTYDAISQYVPYDWSAYRSIREDGYLGWNPYTHSGSSIAANTMACPGDWHHQLHRVLPFWASWNAGILIQFLVAGWGMIVLLHQQRIGTPGQLLGAVGFGFYSQFIVWICHRWVLGAMCWAPWIVWAFLRGRDRGSRFGLLPVAFVALAFRGGHLQTSLFVVLLVGLLALADWWNSGERFKWRRAAGIFVPYLATGAVALLLAADVFLHTVPPYLEGGRELAHKGWLDTLKTLPGLVGLIHPTLTGTPQGLDGLRVFGADLFMLKFFGGGLVVPAVSGFLNGRGPAAAKLLAMVGLAVPFTPLDEWLYSRFTVVFALGAVWLGAWQVQRWVDGRDRRGLKWALWGLGAAVFVWAGLSVVLAIKEAALVEVLGHRIEASLRESKADRLDWMLRRVPVFVDGLYLWHPRNLAVLGLLALGFVILVRISGGRPRHPLHVWVLVLITFAELGLFASTWITFARRSEGSFPYSEPPWMTEVRREVGAGRLVVFTRKNFDFYQLNTGSVYDLRHADGYETVTPKRIDPYPARDWDPDAFASTGVSHVLVPGEAVPGVLAGWDPVLSRDGFVLLANPSFIGLSLVADGQGVMRPIAPSSRTPNRMTFHLPAGSTLLEIKESHARGWRYRFNGGGWQAVEPSAVGGHRVELPGQEESTVELRYEPPFRRWGWFLWGLAGLVLASHVWWVRQGSGRIGPAAAS